MAVGLSYAAYQGWSSKIAARILNRFGIWAGALDRFFISFGEVTQYLLRHRNSSIRFRLQFSDSDNYLVPVHEDNVSPPNGDRGNDGAKWNHAIPRLN